MQYLIKIAILIILLSACNSYKTKYPYSLNDFRPELRMHLEKIIENGGMCDYDNNENVFPDYYRYFSEKISVEDLHKLIICEHPILRAMAFGYLREKDSLNISKILFDHLDDTAIITHCMGEFGPEYIYVSDYFLDATFRQTKISKDILIDKVITTHSYLSFAYKFIGALETPQEKYYPTIKKMAEISHSSLYYEDLYYKKEIALYALSKYKKKDDISFIAKELSQHWRLFSGYYNYTFSIIKENPDTAYFKIIESFYRGISIERTRKQLQYGVYKSPYHIEDKFSAFLRALVAYKNKRASEMLETIIKKELYPFDFSNLENYRYTIYKLVLKNNCAAYKNLIKLLKQEAKAFKNNESNDEQYSPKAHLEKLYGLNNEYKYW